MEFKQIRLWFAETDDFVYGFMINGVFFLAYNGQPWDFSDHPPDKIEEFREWVDLHDQLARHDYLAEMEEDQKILYSMDSSKKENNTMYQIQFADLYHSENGTLDWKLYIDDIFPNEKEAWERIGKEMQEDYDTDCLGRFVYKVVQKEG